MPANPRRIPSYRLHKPTGQAVVRLDGRDHYLGKHGTDASQEAYRRAIAEWLTAGPPTKATSSKAPAVATETVSVAELLLWFMTRHASTHYRRADGTPTDEIENFKQSLRPLKKLYGMTPGKDFGPLALKAVRQAMIDSGLCRNEVNKRVGRVVRMFKWAVENELVPPSVHHGLKAVKGLQRGRSEARETEPIRPVPEAHIDAVRTHVDRRVWAMIGLQLLTGMRPGEVTSMRSVDIDTTVNPWVYRPPSHKMSYAGRERSIFIGPKSQEILRPWLRPDANAYLFSPKEADAEYRAGQRFRRKSPVQPSQRNRRKPSPVRVPGVRWTTHAYSNAIRRACKKANVEPWHTHQLRHNAATRLRREYGLDTARVILGHNSPVVTEIYAEADDAKARAVMLATG